MISYADNTLVTTAEAMLLKELREDVLPKVNKFCDEVVPKKPAEASSYSRFEASPLTNESMLELFGEIETLNLTDEDSGDEEASGEQIVVPIFDRTSLENHAR